MKTILFVCTGNIFRSLTAEYSLKQQLDDKSNTAYHIHSAGTQGNPHGVVPFVTAYLHELGMDSAAHEPRKLTAAMLDEADLIVAMSTDHRAFIRETFGKQVYLFNEISYGTQAGILDVGEADLPADPAAQKAYALSVIDYIHAAMPAFIERMAQSMDD